MTTMEMNPVQPSTGGRANFRLFAMIAVVGAIVGYPTYQLVRNTLEHGIHKTAGGFDLDLKTIGCFAFDDQTGTDANIPTDFRDLDGKKVSLEGFVFVDKEAAGNLHEFQLVYNVSKCCFGGKPQVQERVFGVMPRHSEVPVPPRDLMMRCTGTLHVKVVRDGGLCTSVYTLDVDHLDPV